MKDRELFLGRAIDSIEGQTYEDYEIIITEEGKMAENTNAAIKKAKGDIIKILFMDDYLAHPNTLKNIVDSFTGGWLVSGNTHRNNKGLINPRFPTFDIWALREGVNTIGSPSILAFENDKPLLFDEEMSWLLDVELYTRLFERYGEPTILRDIGIVIGLGDHQMTNILTDEDKQREVEYLKNK